MKITVGWPDITVRCGTFRSRNLRGITVCQKLSCSPSHAELETIEHFCAWASHTARYVWQMLVVMLNAPNLFAWLEAVGSDRLIGPKSLGPRIVLKSSSLREDSRRPQMLQMANKNGLRTAAPCAVYLRFENRSPCVQHLTTRVGKDRALVKTIEVPPASVYYREQKFRKIS